ncbi:hypothetical protein ABEX78_19740 [Priestia megaterium]|nr:hypothetical protein [Priestia aryabhattai]MDU9693752.1 hypothetical protein [Priestia aryabhattai]NGY88987.1 hypothetical protein [Priestia megaterium]
MTKDGLQSHPFTAYPLPPVKANPHANPELVKERSRQLIGSPKAVVRDSINQRAALDTISSND